MPISSITKQATLAVGIAGLIGLSGTLATSPAEAAVLDGSFDSGFTAWSTLGNSSVVSSSPIGSNSAQLTSEGAGDTDIESFLGINPGTLDSLLPGVNATVGSAIKQSFFANAGEKVSFDWFFETADYLPFNDFAFTTLSSQIGVLSSIGLVGNYGNSGVQNYSFLIPATGTYTLGFGVVNALDSTLSSTLYVDNIRPSTAIPTPALLPGLVGMGIAALRKKRKGEAVEQSAEA